MDKGGGMYACTCASFYMYTCIYLCLFQLWIYICVYRCGYGYGCVLWIVFMWTFPPNNTPLGVRLRPRSHQERRACLFSRMHACFRQMSQKSDQESHCWMTRLFFYVHLWPKLFAPIRKNCGREEEVNNILREVYLFFWPFSNSHFWTSKIFWRPA